MLVLPCGGCLGSLGEYPQGVLLLSLGKRVGDRVGDRSPDGGRRDWRACGGGISAVVPVRAGCALLRAEPFRKIENFATASSLNEASSARCCLLQKLGLIAVADPRDPHAQPAPQEMR